LGQVVIEIIAEQASIDGTSPAEACDIDHTIPYPLGPTHPSNLKLLCRFPHLLHTLRERCKYPVCRGQSKVEYSVTQASWPRRS
jgi:hypothetical protein